MIKGEQTKKSDRIDIYVDASWLSASNARTQQVFRNTASAGGWGAVVLEEGMSPWLLSGPTTDVVQYSNTAEYFGIVEVLRNVMLATHKRTPPPHIFLHTDKIEIVKNINLINNNPNIDKDFIGSNQKLRRYFPEIVNLVKAMAVTVKKGVDAGKMGGVCWHTTAHQLAAREAWLARLEAQNGIINYYGTLLEDDAAKKRIMEMNIPSPQQPSFSR